MEGIPAPTPPLEKPTSGLARLTGTFVSPVRTFDEIARRPTWLAPLLVWTVLSVALWGILIPRADWEEVIRDRFEKKGQALSPDRLERIVERQRQFAWLYYVVAAAGPALIGLFLSALFWLAFKAFGWELAFRQSFGVTAYAFVPGAVLGSLLTFPLLLRLERIDPSRVGDLVKSNPAFLVDGEEAPALRSLLQSLDVFSFWTLALLVVGYAAAAKASRGRSAGLILTLWALYVLGKTGWVALTGA